MITIQSLGAQRLFDQSVLSNFDTAECICDVSGEYGEIVYLQKAIPLWAWAGPEGARRLRLPDFKTVGT